jgi:signal transduction histidine kinase
VKGNGRPKPKAGRRRKSAARVLARPRLPRGQQSIQIQTLSQLVQVLSHETRNILGSFATCLELLRRSSQLNGEDRELVNILQSGARRLNEISEQFAAFSPHAALRLDLLDVSLIIKEVGERLRQDERCPASLDIQIACDPAVGPITGDPNALGKVFWNLFLNAAQAMGEHGTLRIETKRMNGRMEVHVRDTGPGVPASIRQQIFEPLFTTKTRAAGLGLAIARKIVEAHGGKITLQSGTAPGCLFKIALPLTALPVTGKQRKKTAALGKAIA